MRLVIHVGMNKTGSSSIQSTFSRLNNPEYSYVDWKSPNHSPLHILLFQDQLQLANYHIFRAKGPKFARTLPEMRAKWTDKLSRQLSQIEDKTVLFSAEDISNPIFERANREALKFFRAFANEIDVFGYARPPGSFMSSAFQQRLKGGTVALKAFPQYRARFQMIDSVFGQDNVTIREFARSRLLNGDVVQDFAQVAGLPMPAQHQIVRANEGLSLEAVALLYVQRKYGAGKVQGFAQANQVNRTFINCLATIGNGKLVFSERMLAPLLDEIRDDIAWMEQRMGHSFSELGGAAGGIDLYDDLVEIALLNYDAVLDRLGKDAPDMGPANLDNLVCALEMLWAKCYATTFAQARLVSALARAESPNASK